MMRTFIDVTTSRQYAGRPAVGIVRVEREIARHYMNNVKDAELVFFDTASQCYRDLPKYLAGEILRDHPSTMPSGNSESRSLSKSNYGYRTKFNPGDLLINAGLAWDHDLIQHIYTLKKIHSIKLAQVLYDLVPIHMPEYCVPGMETRFPRYLVDVAWTADVVFCISDSCLSDFENFIDEHSLRRPRLERIHLGSTIEKQEFSEASVDPDLTPGHFVVYVSTIEPRKNHSMLFNIWRELYETNRSELMPLLLIGRRGWNMDNFNATLSACSRLYPEYIRVVDSLTDDELNAYYANAAFTVYPSLYEGWGLPIVEALTLGKACIASNTSSIPEASAGLVELLHPHDYIGWRDAIKRYLTDREAVEKKEKLIQEKYTPTKWMDSMQRFSDRLTVLIQGC